MSAFAYDHWETDVPVLLISGQDDPVGDRGTGVQTVFDRMKRTGIENVTLHLLPSARHDILHDESCGAAREARKIILNWLP